MTDWQPIETAPRNGSRVAVWNAYVGEYVSSFCDGEWPLYFWGGLEGVWFPVPTKWHPILPPLTHMQESE